MWQASTVSSTATVTEVYTLGECRALCDVLHGNAVGDVGDA